MTGSPEDKPVGQDMFKKLIHELEGDVSLSIDEFDAESKRILDELKHVVSQFDESSVGDHMEIDSFYTAAASFRKVAAQVIKDQGRNLSSFTLVAKLYKNDRDRRVGVLNGFIDSAHYIKESDEREFIDNFAPYFTPIETEGEGLDAMETFYTLEFKQDLELLLDYLIELHTDNYHEEHDHSNEESEQATLEIKKSPADHIVDVAKIAAGVFAALAVDRLIHRHK